jgi:Ca2+-binding EF-hand superfamily protein
LFSNVLENLDKFDPQHKAHPEKIQQENSLAYWFVSVDSDGNGFIDGYELMAALTLGMDPTTGYKLEEVVKHIDDIMKSDDINNE